MKSFAVIAAAAASLVGCAASTDAPVARPGTTTELVYRTGSNIPVRNVVPMTQEEKDKQREENQRVLENIQRGGANPMKN